MPADTTNRLCPFVPTFEVCLSLPDKIGFKHLPADTAYWQCQCVPTLPGLCLTWYEVGIQNVPAGTSYCLCLFKPTFACHGMKMVSRICWRTQVIACVRLYQRYLAFVLSWYEVGICLAIQVIACVRLYPRYLASARPGARSALLDWDGLTHGRYTTPLCLYFFLVDRTMFMERSFASC